MSNFKIGQKVVYIGNDPLFPKRQYHTITALYLCDCGNAHADFGYKLPPEFNCTECYKCGRIEWFVFTKSTCVLRPLSYTSNTNLEIISLFAPTEERADLTPEPKKETA